MEIVEHKSKALHEIENYIHAAIMLQLASKDVAIPYLQGAPGCGKTSIINAWTKKYDWNIMSIHFALMPIEEISGIPLVKKIYSGNNEFSGTEWTLPGIISKLFEFDQKKPTVLFLDDFHLCSPDHLNLGFEMFTNRSIHGYKLPDNVAFILAGNASSKAGSKIGNSAIINRCSINPVMMDFDYWKKSFAIPKSINSKILSFLSNEKNKKFFHMDEMLNKPWASPRSWTRLSEVLNVMEQMYKVINFSDLIYYAEGHVGAEAGTEFTSFYKLYRETEMDKVFDAKKEIDIPDDMTGQYIYMMAAVDEFGNRLVNNPDNAYSMLAKISVKIGEKNVSIATVGSKELTTFFSFNVWNTFMNYIKDESIDIYNDIDAEITLI